MSLDIKTSCLSLEPMIGLGSVESWPIKLFKIWYQYQKSRYIFICIDKHTGNSSHTKKKYKYNRRLDIVYLSQYFSNLSITKV